MSSAAASGSEAGWKANLQRSILGRMTRRWGSEAPLKTVRVVSATRMSESAFWNASALGRSLRPWLHHPSLSTRIAFENAAPLADVYNPHLDRPDDADMLVFVHDDVWLDDSDWMAKLRAGFQRFDVIGVAGSRTISPGQPSWSFISQGEGGDLTWNFDELSGAVAHGDRPHGPVSNYGPAPAACVLLDGVFIAVRVGPLHRSRVRFDERLAFHFYDLDFCRSAERARLRLGTWPIELTHQSGGSFDSENWRSTRDRYFEKWGG